MPTFHPSNPLVTDIDAGILAAQREVNVALAAFPHPDVRTPEGLQQLRLLTANNKAGTVLEPLDRYVPTPGGDMRMRIFIPEDPVRAVFLRIHGGGHCAGMPEDDDSLNDLYARECHVVVASPDYRLCPDITLVEQIEDCVAAAEWLAMHAQSDYGTSTLLIGGISAGGYLAAATVLHLRERNRAAFDMFVAAALDSGHYDLGRTASSWLANDQTLVVTGKWIEAFWDLALPGYDTEQRRVPRLSPMLNDLSGLPAALFTVGNLDPLRDESILMAQRWQLAGSFADLDVWPEGAHAFSNMGTPLAQAAAQRTVAWLNSALERNVAYSPVLQAVSMQGSA